VSLRGEFGLKVLVGGCGTDDRHIEALAGGSWSGEAEPHSGFECAPRAV
jgi:hypothetical protein